MAWGAGWGHRAEILVLIGSVLPVLTWGLTEDCVCDILGGWHLIILGPV